MCNNSVSCGAFVLASVLVVSLMVDLASAGTYFSFTHARQANGAVGVPQLRPENIDEVRQLCSYIYKDSERAKLVKRMSQIEQICMPLLLEDAKQEDLP